MEPLTTVGGAIALLNATLNSLKQAKDLAKDSSSAELKEKLSEILDHFLDLKERVLDLREENEQLRQQLKAATEKQQLASEVYRNGPFVYRKGDADPCCSKCWDSDQKLIHLTRTRNFQPLCPACKNYFEEQGK